MKSIKNDRLIWLDMEMTGLDLYKERILEIAVVVTEGDLSIVAEGPTLVIHQDNQILSCMDKWNTITHNKSSLINKVKLSNLKERDAEKIIISFLENYVEAKTSPLCGNTVHQDRSFMKLYMPDLESFFHYRNLDVSSIKELVKRWYPNSSYKFIKNNRHEALSDIYESIEELKFYRNNFFIHDN